MDSRLNNENKYLDLLQRILNEGEKRSDRTGVGTISLFGVIVEYDISESVPIFTTKKVLWEKVIIELLWILSGSTNVDILKEKGVNFWNANVTRDFLDGRGLKYLREGDIGATYGHQLRHFGAEYKGCDYDYTGCGVDQLKQLIENLKKDPFSRRHVVSLWNPQQLDEMALPPCAWSFQVNIVEIEGVRYLDLMLNQRSADAFLGLQFNVCSYSFLACIICNILEIKPRRFIHSIGDAHIYINHIDAVKKQLSRKPFPPPTLKFKRKIEDIDNFIFDDFIVENYKHHSFIKADMAV